MVIDRSGSMKGTELETISGFNSFVADQKKLQGDADLTLTLFDSTVNVIHNGLALADVPELDGYTYVPNGYTALLDAIGKTVNAMGARFAAMTEDERPSKVILLIITDGEENSSKEFDNTRIRDMLKEQQEKYSWEVLYFGANQDAFDVGTKMGVNSYSTVDYMSTPMGTNNAYMDISRRVTTSRNS